MIPQNNADIVAENNPGDIGSVEALRILNTKWKTYNRASFSDDHNLSWLSGYMELLRDAGIDKYLALRMLKGGI